MRWWQCISPFFLYLNTVVVDSNMQGPIFNCQLHAGRGCMRDQLGPAAAARFEKCAAPLGSTVLD
jgi:hypothetical protein